MTTASPTAAVARVTSACPAKAVSLEGDRVSPPPAGVVVGSHTVNIGSNISQGLRGIGSDRVKVSSAGIIRSAAGAVQGSVIDFFHSVVDRIKDGCTSCGRGYTQRRISGLHPRRHRATGRCRSDGNPRGSCHNRRGSREEGWKVPARGRNSSRCHLLPRTRTRWGEIPRLTTKPTLVPIGTVSGHVPLDAAEIADEGLTPIPETAEVTINIYEARGSSSKGHQDQTSACLDVRLADVLLALNIPNFAEARKDLFHKVIGKFCRVVKDVDHG